MSDLLQASDPYAQNHFDAYDRDLQAADVSIAGPRQREDTLGVEGSHADRHGGSIPWQ